MAPRHRNKSRPMPCLRRLAPLALLLALAACTPPSPEAGPPAAAAAPAGAAQPADTTGEPADLVVEGRWVVTMDGGDRVIERGAVAVDVGVIVAVGPADETDARYAAGARLAGDDRVCMPGLGNGHSHAAMTLLRGVADDLELMTWLNNYICPAEVEFVDPE